MLHVDRYGLALTAGADAVAAYNRGIGHLLRLERGAVEAVASAVAFDQTFALGHAALALLGHEFCAPVDVGSRMRDARLHARRSTERERSHVHAVDRHLAGDSAPLVQHLERYPADALLLSVAVPTIAFAGVTTVPEQAWRIVEQCGPAYGNDWWYAGLLAFMRQEQGLFDEAMDLSRASLADEPAAGHSAHARAHAHYETADHAAGLAWMDDWITGAGARADSLTHFSWHAALHELAMGDTEAVRQRYYTQLAPPTVTGVRALIDSASLLWRWVVTTSGWDAAAGTGAFAGETAPPPVECVLDAAGSDLVDRPETPFVALHSALALAAASDLPRLARLHAHCAD
ncbi:MAG TPA: pyridine nucleotide-disulfide oxidoreductase, partial [Marmoricola sp.]